jgi:hypothetical protein
MLECDSGDTLSVPVVRRNRRRYREIVVVKAGYELESLRCQDEVTVGHLASGAGRCATGWLARALC